MSTERTHILVLRDARGVSPRFPAMAGDVWAQGLRGLIEPEQLGLRGQRDALVLRGGFVSYAVADKNGRAVLELARRAIRERDLTALRRLYALFVFVVPRMPEVHSVLSQLLAEGRRTDVSRIIGTRAERGAPMQCPWLTALVCTVDALKQEYGLTAKAAAGEISRVAGPGLDRIITPRGVERQYCEFRRLMQLYISPRFVCASVLMPMAWHDIHGNDPERASER